MISFPWSVECLAQFQPQSLDVSSRSGLSHCDISTCLRIHVVYFVSSLCTRSQKSLCRLRLKGGGKIPPPKKKNEYKLPACAYKSHCHYYKTAVPQIRQSVTVPHKTCPWCWSQMHSPPDIKQAFAPCWCSLTWHITSGDSVLLRCWAVSYNLNTSSSS